MELCYMVNAYVCYLCIFLQHDLRVTMTYLEKKEHGLCPGIGAFSLQGFIQPFRGHQETMRAKGEHHITAPA